MKMNSHVRESMAKVIELRLAGHNAREISEQVGKSKSFIDRMLRNLPKLIGYMLDEQTT
jgi:transposase